MGITIKESDLNYILKKELNKIFENKIFKNLSNFQRRKCIFDYLVSNCDYDFSLLNDIYSGKQRMYADEILSILDPDTEKKGICNSFSYSYKILLDKLNIPSMLIYCVIKEKNIKDLENQGVKTSKLKQDSSGMYLIPHMLVLVQNDNGTFSFDDITYAIFNKGTLKENDFFNYTYQMAKENKQTNFEGFDTDMLRCIVENSTDTINDELIRKKYAKQNNEGFLEIPIELIHKYNELGKKIEGEQIR